jgi:hypothetical protein
MAIQAEQAIGSAAVSVQWENRQLYQFYGAPKPDGVTEKSLAISLPANAVVKKYEVVMTAAPAHAVSAAEAGQVRATPADGSMLNVVIDFGTPRTVSAVGVPSGALITSVSSWIGTEFASPAKFTSDGTDFARLPSEVRTERLQLLVSGNPSTQSLGTDTVVVLPESPSGIEVRVDGGAPAFSQTAAVDPTTNTALSSTEWNTDSQRIADLGPTLAALTGSPLDESTKSVTAKLTSATPGKLSFDLHPGGQTVSLIRRATFNGQPQTDVAFDLEGQSMLALASMPSGLTVEDVKLIVTGTPPAVRVVPPFGPDAPDPAFADFTLNSTRAAIIQLPIEARFKELNAVRFPIGAASGGAEARVVLWRSKDLINQSPSAALDNGSSAPVTLAESSEAWQTFTWKKPIPVPKDYVLWAALIVTRGSASMVFASSSGGAGAQRFLWGAPTGPWHDLPDALADVRGRIRLVGTPKPDAVYPPLEIQLAAGATTSVIPNPKGAAVEITGAPAAQSGPVTLILTSHAPATVTLKNIDVISTT